MLIAVTQERLKELLHYDPDTGVFTWRVASGRVDALGDYWFYPRDLLKRVKK